MSCSVAHGRQTPAPARRCAAVEGITGAGPAATGRTAADVAGREDPVDKPALTGGRQYHVVEMESSAMFVVARRRGLRAGMMCAVSGNLVTGDVVHGEESTWLRTGWVHSVTAAPEGLRALPA